MYMYKTKTRKSWQPLFLGLTLMLTGMVLLGPLTGAVLAGQDKTPVCHLDDDGNFILISIADPALDAHLEHGDLIVGVDVDENCEPLVAQIGCQLILTVFGFNFYYPTDGSAVQAIDNNNNALYRDASCETVSGTTLPAPRYLIWAASPSEAQATCTALLGNNAFPFPTLTPNLYLCGRFG